MASRELTAATFTRGGGAFTPQPARVGRLPLGEPGADVQRAVQGAYEIGAQPGGLGQGPVLGGDPPAEQQDVGAPAQLGGELDGPQVSGADGEPVQGQHPGGGGEDPGPVRERDEKFDADGFRGVLLVRGLGLGVQGEDRLAGAQGLDGQAFLFGARGRGLGLLRFLMRRGPPRRV